MRILLVEPSIVAAIDTTKVLKLSGFAVDNAETGEEALDLIRHYDYDLVVVELILPDMEGHEVVRRMRSAKFDIPVIMMSQELRPELKVRALDAGADDFMIKPFDGTELVARTRAIVRRTRSFSHSSLRVGELCLNIDSKEVLFAGFKVHLTVKEYEMLELLVLRKGLILSKEAFLTHLYGGMDEPEIKIIDVFICKIRKKLHALGAKNLITTVWGRGYKLRTPASERLTDIWSASTLDEIGLREFSNAAA